MKYQSQQVRPYPRLFSVLTSAIKVRHGSIELTDKDVLRLQVFVPAFIFMQIS